MMRPPGMAPGAGGMRPPGVGLGPAPRALKPEEEEALVEEKVG